MSSSTFKSWLAKPSNCLGNSSAFQTYLSVCDLQRGSLARTESRFMVGWEIFKLKKLPCLLQAPQSEIASLLTSSFLGPTLALFYYPHVVCQCVYSLSCKADEISLPDDYSKHKILLGFLKKYFFKCWLTVEALYESLTAEKSTVAEGFPLLYSRNRRFFPLPNPGNFLSPLSNFFSPHNRLRLGIEYRNTQYIERNIVHIFHDHNSVDDAFLCQHSWLLRWFSF